MPAVTTTFAPDDKLILTNLKKVFWPEHGYTKGDLIAYYREIAPVILPYLADRPQILHRHVDGHVGKEFFQRVSRQRPTWLQVVDIVVSGRRRPFISAQTGPRCFGSRISVASNWARGTRGSAPSIVRTT